MKSASTAERRRGLAPSTLAVWEEEAVVEEIRRGCAGRLLKEAKEAMLLPYFVVVAVNIVEAGQHLVSEELDIDVAAFWATARKLQDQSF